MSEGNGFASREQFLAANTRRYTEVSIDGFGKVRLQSLTEGEKSNWEAMALSKKGGMVKDRLIDARLRLLILCVVDKAGKRLFANDDLPQLLKLDSTVSAAIYDAARAHVGLDKEDVEDLVKNSERVNVDASPSA